MTATNAVIGSQDINFQDQDWQPSEVDNEATMQLCAIGSLCNAADFDAADTKKPVAERRIFGDATDQAVLRLTEQFRERSSAYLRQCWRMVYELPFDSKNKFMVRCYTNVDKDALRQTLSSDEVAKFTNTDL